MIPRMQSATANAPERERHVRFSKIWRREAPSCIGQPHFIVETDSGQIVPLDPISAF
jgi:hypothetical protein